MKHYLLFIFIYQKHHFPETTKESLDNLYEYFVSCLMLDKLRKTRVV